MLPDPTAFFLRPITQLGPVNLSLAEPRGYGPLVLATCSLAPNGAALRCNPLARHAKSIRRLDLSSIWQDDTWVPCPTSSRPQGKQNRIKHHFQASKGNLFENWPGALHSEVVSCMLSVGPEIKMEIEARMKIRVDREKTK